MLSAIRSFFKGYANFSGRSTRPEFWWVWLLNMVIFLPAYYSLFTGVESDKAIRNIAVFSMCIILFIVEFVPLLALIVRRLRDVGIHWAYIFIVFVPLKYAPVPTLFTAPVYLTFIVPVDVSVFLA